MKLMIERGITYNPESGLIYGVKGKEFKVKNKRGYIQVSTYKGKMWRVYGHQFAYYYIYGKIVNCLDHINGIKYDNRICNLREVTYSENSWNQKKNARGYSAVRNGLYQSRIRINGKLKSLGYYKNTDDARNAYLEAKKRYHNWN